MKIENFVSDAVLRSAEALYGRLEEGQLQIQKTRREFEGDYTLVTFPLLRRSRKSPEATANEIGEHIVAHTPEIRSFNVIKGFLNLTLDCAFWQARFAEIAADDAYGTAPATGRTVMIEYSSPNTNKPLHLGHVRNNLLGYSVARILEANGHTVIKANLVNDRGIHICKSMLAWKLYGGGETPASSGMKGDHLVGKYYVEFDKRYKAQIRELVADGQSEEEAKKNAPILVEAQEMLRRWEAKDPEVYDLWQTMNGWVYDGFDVTYKALGVEFDKVYYESQTYLLGKSIVDEGLRKGVFYRRPDNSVWIDLTGDGLDEKLLLRGDGTSVYMTQDLGTAFRRFEDNRLDDMIYVVGNEQNYHFQVLKLVLKKLGYAWSDHITHLSYGMVELPEGKMKSREGTVVDADDLITAMVKTAREMSDELGKLDGCSEEEAAAVSEMVGLGALKYFILKVDPKKTMLFDPRESIDFNGNTGPFIQYTHARIRSVLRKAAEAGIDFGGDIPSVPYVPEEIELVKSLTDYPSAVAAAGENFAPSIVAAYAYELAKQFNGYYHDHSILKEENSDVRRMRLQLAQQVARVIRSAMKLLGIDVPERM
ncbi:arginine--tRNA ligase [uncultured Alistipes sp.]|uniref:arginine--tRNA ligase n=1 Tax=uncultured Alistipes sp. TaxID=538949 RepID=UPI0026018383|nr:arginine--tRNA ligase [uncultured Alistipes sp.]